MDYMQHGDLSNKGNHGNVTIERMDPRLLVGEPTYLFNIYVCEFNQNTGTTGCYYIPPCPENKEWVRAPQHVPGTVADTYPHFTDKEVYRMRPTVGDDVVAGILGISSGQGPSEDIRRFGVFASQNIKPTKEELRDANAVLNKELARIVQEADSFMASADPAVRSSISDKHWAAARRLRVKRSWMQETTALAACPFCSSPVTPGVPKCANCHEVIDPVAYAALKAQMGVTA